MALVLVSFPREDVAHITLNDPDNLNAMSEQMAAEFVQVITDLKRKASLRVVLLSGSGRAFSAGGDLEMLQKKSALSGEENRIKMLDFYRSFLSILSLELPLIALINGPAVGAGLCLAAACDLRIAATGAKLGFTFVKLGLYPGMGATYFLSRAVGPARASELLLTGRIIEAEEAARFGLVSRVVEPGSLEAEGLSLAAEIADSGPEAVRQLLITLRRGTASLEESLDREAFAQSLSYLSADFGTRVAKARSRKSRK